MTLPESSWVRYTKLLSSINSTAARKYEAYLKTHETGSKAGRKAAIDYAAALVQKYGESAAAVSCEMYDGIAEAAGVLVPAAEPAAVATYGEVAKTVNGMMKQEQPAETIASAIGRLVKRTGADTTLQNAKRDGAEFAWIPHGDTCSFCLMLASNGWRKASKKTIKGDHAEHIHSGCDCEFAIRFDGKPDYAGYDPEKYRAMYDNAEGDTWKEKLNSMRRTDYAANAEKYRAQDRAAYRRRMGRPELFDQPKTEKNEWPKEGEKIKPEQFKEIRAYADEKGVTLRGVKNSDVDLDLVQNAIDKTSEILDKYGLRELLPGPFTLDFSHILKSGDFATTYPRTTHVIYFNKDAFRSVDALKKAYLEGGLFVPGTSYLSIPYHEMGHIIADVYEIDPLKIARRLTGKETADDILDYVTKNLSKYAGAYKDGREIISECFSAVYSGIDNDFALRFVEECDKIITNKR